MAGQSYLVRIKASRSRRENLISTCGTLLPNEDGGQNALSADGRTIYFAPTGHEAEGVCPSGARAPETTQLYARIDGEEAGAETVAISQPECGAGAEPAEVQCREAAAHPSAARFAGASRERAVAYFLDTQQLTDGATQGMGSAGGCVLSGAGCNLYLYDFAEPAGHNLVDVSEGVSGAPAPGGVGGPRVQGVAAVSEDGSHVYFVAKGKLADNRSALGAEAVAGEDNLYVYERDAHYPAGHTAFIAALPNTYHTVDEEEIEPGGIIDLEQNVTPEGRFLVFASHGELTPDDTRGDGGTGGAQIFRYDAATEQLTRVSIGGEGFDDAGNAGAGNAELALAVDVTGGHRRDDPTMSDDGSRIFFTSPVGLTPKALDDVPAGYTVSGEAIYVENVYEWEREGAGSCPAGHVAGCTYLISDGRDTAEAGGGRSAVKLIGSDASGDNVFFTTADQLVPADTDTELDVYDARVCEPEGCIAEPTPPLPPCLGEQCHGIPAATPSLLAPGTASFNGEGNITPAAAPAVAVKPLTRAQKLAAALKACGKDRKKAKRASCERTARKNFGPVKKSKKAKR